MQLKPRDGSPFLWVSFTDANGKRHRKSTGHKDRRLANKEAAKIIAEADEEAPKGSTVTLYAALNAYQANLTLQGKVSAGDAATNRDKTCGKLPSSPGRFNLDPDMPFHTLDETHLQAIIEAQCR